LQPLDSTVRATCPPAHSSSHNARACERSHCTWYWLRWAWASHTYTSRTVPDLRDRPAWSACLFPRLLSLLRVPSHSSLEGLWPHSGWLSACAHVGGLQGEALCRGVYQKLVNPTPKTKHPTFLPPQDANIGTVAAAVQYSTVLLHLPTCWVIVTAETCSSKSQPVQGVAYRVQNIATAP
jgi:hypothetical protein